MSCDKTQQRRSDGQNRSEGPAVTQIDLAHTDTGEEWSLSCAANVAPTTTTLADAAEGRHRCGQIISPKRGFCLPAGDQGAIAQFNPGYAGL
jgi:hypothetical protein